MTTVVDWEALSIEQDLRAEWSRCLARACVVSTAPLAIKVWDEYFQPALDRKLGEARKPYDQETDVCGMCPDTPQQDDEARGLRELLKQSQGQVGHMRAENQKLKSELFIRNNSNGFGRTADAEHIRELTNEVHDLRDQNEELQERFAEWQLLLDDRDHFRARWVEVQEKLDGLHQWETIATNRLAFLDNLERELKETTEKYLASEEELGNALMHMASLRRQLTDQCATLQAAQIHAHRAAIHTQRASAVLGNDVEF